MIELTEDELAAAELLADAYNAIQRGREEDRLHFKAGDLPSHIKRVRTMSDHAGARYPGVEQRCARCHHIFYWLTEQRTHKLDAVDAEPVLGGKLERIDRDAYFTGEGHPAMMGYVYHAQVCDLYLAENTERDAAAKTTREDTAKRWETADPDVPSTP